jgi:hypothetical protein
MPRQHTIVVFTDDDGDEFPIMRFPGESLEVVTEAALRLVGDGWNPEGELTFDREEDV